MTLREFDERLTYLKNLEARKTEVLRSIEEQGGLTDELQQKIEAATVLQLSLIHISRTQEVRRLQAVVVQRGHRRRGGCGISDRHHAGRRLPRAERADDRR